MQGKGQGGRGPSSALGALPALGGDWREGVWKTVCPRGTCEGSFPAPLEGLLRPTVELRLLGKESPVSAP